MIWRINCSTIRPRHTLQRSEARSRGSVASTVGRVQRFQDSISQARFQPCEPHTLKAAPAAAILVSESGATGETKSGATVFDNRALTGETAAACVKMETESSVLIRPLIALLLKGLAAAEPRRMFCCCRQSFARSALGNRKRREAAALSPSPPNQFARFCGQCCDGIETPETLEFSGSISGQTHRRTNFSQFRRLFVDICGQPPLA